VVSKTLHVITFMRFSFLRFFSKFNKSRAVTRKPRDAACFSLTPNDSLIALLQVLKDPGRYNTGLVNMKFYHPIPLQYFFA